MSDFLSPDCRDNNHIKCDGTAWDTEQDHLCECFCQCHQDHGQGALDPGPPWQLLGTTESGFRVFTAPAGVAIPGLQQVANETGKPERIIQAPRISDR